ncbi:MAG: HAD hydrolase-like protein [Kiritimatiellae bacterium]|nr:HAD hydrolase-like protein [Kiritimatiellia bacterium]
MAKKEIGYQLEDQESIQEKTLEGSPFALFFELDGVVHARKATFEVFSSLLNEQNIKLTHSQFAKYCHHASPYYYLPELLEQVGAKKISADKLADDVMSGVATHLTSKEAVLADGFEKILKYATREGIRLGALSALPGSTAKSLMAQHQFNDMGAELFTFEGNNSVFPRADMWLKMAKQTSRSPQSCIVFSTSTISCKSALSANMRCVAVPDEFTNFQDFGGSDMIVDSYQEIDPQKLFDLIFAAV